MRWMQGSSGEEDCGCDGYKVRGDRKTADAMDARFYGRERLRMRWMQGTRGEEVCGCDACNILGGEEDCGCDGCKVLGKRKTADAMDARY